MKKIKKPVQAIASIIAIRIAICGTNALFPIH